MVELSKKERKIARSIIETGIQRQFQKGLNSIDSILLNWKDNKLITAKENKSSRQSVQMQL